MVGLKKIFCNLNGFYTLFSWGVVGGETELNHLEGEKVEGKGIWDKIVILGTPNCVPKFEPNHRWQYI